MLQSILLIVCVVVIALGILLVPFPHGAVGIGLVFVMSALFIFAFRKFTEEKSFVTTLFLGALALRMAFGVFIIVFELQGFFGGDYFAYDLRGSQLVDAWTGRAMPDSTLEFHFDPRSGAGYGMYYITAGIYYVLGRNVFAAQSFCAVIGAATATMVFFLTRLVYSNLKVAKMAAIGVAVFPSFIIWSGQLLKDGVVIFLLVLGMTMVLVLQKKFNYFAVVGLIISMFGVITLRFYIFYMLAIAVASAFLVGLSSSRQAFARNVVILIIAGIALTYLGVGRQASVELSTFANLERIQLSRSDLARAAESGFGDDIDVSTTGGAISALPVGLAYLMLAPFPWQAANIRQAITIPEVLVWWGMLPFLVIGVIYTVRNRLTNAFPMLMFSLMLTLAYAIFQGNVGTAYRQRTQIQVFLFVLIAAGWTVFQEQRENKRLIRQASQQRIEDHLRTRTLATKT